MGAPQAAAYSTVNPLPTPSKHSQDQVPGQLWSHALPWPDHHPAACRANLRLADASGQSPLVKAVKRSILPVVKVLLSAGVPCNDVDPATGQVPVIIASEKLAFLAVRQSKDSGCAGTLLALLAHPATNVNARNVSGRTPLHLLLRNGATAGLAATVLQQCCKLDLNVQDNDRNTPLHVALKELYPANQAAATPLVVTMVKRSGTRLDIPDARRDTAMHLACKCNEEVRHGREPDGF